MMEPLTHVHFGFGNQLNLLPSIDDANDQSRLCVGQFLYSEEAQTFAVIVGETQDGQAPVLFFDRINSAGVVCPRHGEDGRSCWRIRLPVQSERVSVGQSWRASPGLVARPGGSGNVTKIVRCWERCYQEVGEGLRGPEPAGGTRDPSKYMHELLGEAAEDLERMVSGGVFLRDDARAVFIDATCVHVTLKDSSGGGGNSDPLHRRAASGARSLRYRVKVVPGRSRSRERVWHAEIHVPALFL